MSTKKNFKKDGDDKKKQQAEDEEAARAFEEFVETFQNDSSKSNKIWVKAGTFNAGSKEHTNTSDRGQLYRPKSRFEPIASDKDQLDRQKARQDKVTKKKDAKKSKSNLEIFKDELKRIQGEREERHRLKNELVENSQILNNLPIAPVFDPNNLSLASDSSQANDALDVSGNPIGAQDSSELLTTNLYLGNLSPNLSEDRLMEIFGAYGPLGSVKIMWPRSEDERSRGKNCGFVAFMNRKDAEMALSELSGKTFDNFEMRLGWGKRVPLPPTPVYVPSELAAQLERPPPPSGLPFNAQPHKRDRHKLSVKDRIDQDTESTKKFHEILRRAVVKVISPMERHVLHLINRFVEFVIREGPLFEAIMMERERRNDSYRFLTDNQSPEHIYYRWRLFSVLQGDSVHNWSTKSFRMFEGGSIWIPPPHNPYDILPVKLEKQKREQELINSKRLLSDSQRARFENMLRHITVERQRIGEIMVWCLDHADSAEEVCTCIVESMSNVTTKLPIKIARLYLICDILHNSGCKVSNASKYRISFQERLPLIFEQLYLTYGAIESRLRAQAFKQRVTHVFRAWVDSNMYHQEYLIQLQNIFLGLNKSNEAEAAGAQSPPASASHSRSEAAQSGAGSTDCGDTQEQDGSGRGDDSSDDDIDGVPLDGETLLKQAMKSSAGRQTVDDGRPMTVDCGDTEDIDGVPLVEATASKPMRPSAGFVPSRWETIDPDDVQASAVTSARWPSMVGPADPRVDMFGRTRVDSDDEDDEDIDGVPLDDSVTAQGYSRPLHSPCRQSGHTVRSADSRSRTSDDGGASSVSQAVDDITQARRERLREIELKVMSYQDDLENGNKPVKSGYTLREQVTHYREKLLKKVDRYHSDEASSDPAQSGTHRRKRKDRSVSPGGQPSSRSGGSSCKYSRQRSPSRKHRRRSDSPATSPQHRYRRSSDHSSARDTPTSRHHHRSAVQQSLERSSEELGLQSSVSKTRERDGSSHRKSR